MALHMDIEMQARIANRSILLMRYEIMFGFQGEIAARE